MVLLRVVGFAALAAAQPRVGSTRFIPTIRPGVEQADPFRSFGTVDQLYASTGVEQADPYRSFGTVDQLYASTGIPTTFGSTWETPAFDSNFGDWEYGAATAFPSYEAPVVFPAPVLPAANAWTGFEGFGTFEQPAYNFGGVAVAAPVPCCYAVTAECLACSAGKSVAEYCLEYSFLPGCPAAAPVVNWAPPVVDWSAPVVDWSAPVVDWSAPVVDWSAPVVDWSAPVVDWAPVDVVPTTPVCSQMMCMMFCEAGFEQDEFGCDVCSCKEVAAPAHNCKTREMWSDEKSAWCCENQRRGCPAESRAADEDEEVEAGCCFSFGFGAMMKPCCFNSEESVAEVDCNVASRLGGNTKWVAGECPLDLEAAVALDSDDEPEPEAEKFNCLTRERFTNEKAAWCCSNKNVGCLYTVLTPVDAPSAVQVDDPTSDETCDNGVLSEEGEACCPKECGTCGGAQCGNRPGGASNCCSQTILSNEMLCTKANAPCVMTAQDDKEDPMDVVQAGARHSIVG